MLTFNMKISLLVDMLDNDPVVQWKINIYKSSMFNYAMYDYKYIASENYGTFVFTA